MYLVLKSYKFQEISVMFCFTTIGIYGKTLQKWTKSVLKKLKSRLEETRKKFGKIYWYAQRPNLQVAKVNTGIPRLTRFQSTRFFLWILARFPWLNMEFFLEILLIFRKSLLIIKEFECKFNMTELWIIEFLFKLAKIAS